MDASTILELLVALRLARTQLSALGPEEETEIDVTPDIRFKERSVRYDITRVLVKRAGSSGSSSPRDIDTILELLVALRLARTQLSALGPEEETEIDIVPDIRFKEGGVRYDITKVLVKRA